MTAAASDSSTGTTTLHPTASYAEQLGVAVWRTLNRTFKNRFSVSFLRALAGGIFTLGILPIFGLGRRFRDYISFERQQMSHLSEWLRLHHDNEDADALRDLSSVIRFNEAIYWFSVACVTLAAAVVLFASRPMRPAVAFGVTYGVEVWEGEITPVFLIWNVLLSMAYFLHWAQVRMYVRRLRMFVEQFNKVTSHQALEPVKAPHLKLGLRLGWIGAAIVLVWMGAFWGVPLALAGASQRRYINTVAQRVREQMADRVRAMMVKGGSVSAAPVDYRIHGPRCERESCKARLPAGAKFCPRCGAPAIAPVDPIHDDSMGGPA